MNTSKTEEDVFHCFDSGASAYLSKAVTSEAFVHRSGKYAPPAEAPRPGLILLDLNMPKKDGREALREIKADQNLRQIAVVVLTTSKVEEDFCAATTLGPVLLLANR